MSLATRARPLDDVRGLVWGTVKDAIARYKGSPGDEVESDWVTATATGDGSDELVGDSLLPGVSLSTALAQQLEATEGALVYVTDQRAWLGGLKSCHARVVAIDEALSDQAITMGPEMMALVGQKGAVRMKRLY